MNKDLPLIKQIKSITSLDWNEGALVSTENGMVRLSMNSFHQPHSVFVKKSLAATKKSFQLSNPDLIF